MPGANGRRAGMGNPEPCPSKCQLLDAPGSIRVDSVRGWYTAAKPGVATSAAYSRQLLICVSMIADAPITSSRSMIA